MSHRWPVEREADKIEQLLMVEDCLAIFVIIGAKI